MQLCKNYSNTNRTVRSMLDQQSINDPLNSIKFHWCSRYVYRLDRNTVNVQGLHRYSRRALRKTIYIFLLRNYIIGSPHVTVMHATNCDLHVTLDGILYTKSLATRRLRAVAVTIDAKRGRQSTRTNYTYSRRKCHAPHSLQRRAMLSDAAICTPFDITTQSLVAKSRAEPVCKQSSASLICGRNRNVSIYTTTITTTTT